MPFAALIPAISSLIGGIASGIGGKTAGQKSTPTEPGYWGQFRQGLVPQFNSALFNAYKPVYGQGHIASYLNGLNANTNQASSKVMGMLAGAGGLGSGRASTTLANLEGNRLSNYAQFMGNLPFQEASLRNDNISKLLGLGFGAAGAPPVSQNVTQTGNGTLSGILGNIGGLFAQGSLGQGAFGRYLNPEVYKQNQQFNTILQNLMGTLKAAPTNGLNYGGIPINPGVR